MACNSSDPYGWIIQLDAAGRLLYMAGDGGTWEFNTYNTGQTALSLNTWYHVAMTKSGTTWNIYVDGTLYPNFPINYNYEFIGIAHFSIKGLKLLRDSYNKLNDKRINECGNEMEPIFTSTDKQNIIPLNKSSGYPDRELKDEAYIEIKLVGEKQLETSFRSFYISTLNKINKPLPHILVAFIHINGKLGSCEPIVKDIRDIELTLKCEWNTSNKYLYYVKPFIDFTKKDIVVKSYRELQKLCKSFRIRANQPKDVLKEALIQLI